MPEPAPSPFLAIPSEEWVCANDLAFAIYDRIPVSPGHVLVNTKSVVPTFFERSVDELWAHMALVTGVKGAIQSPPTRLRRQLLLRGRQEGAGPLHIVPRDSRDSRSGVTEAIPAIRNRLVAPENDRRNCFSASIRENDGGIVSIRD